MEDFVALAVSISDELSEEGKKEKFCELLLDEFKTLKGKDLVPYLSEFTFNKKLPGVTLTLQFPLKTHEINA